MLRSKKWNRGLEGLSFKIFFKKKVKEDLFKKVILFKKIIGIMLFLKFIIIIIILKKIKFVIFKIVYLKKKGKGKVVKNCYCLGGLNWKFCVKKGF